MEREDRHDERKQRRRRKWQETKGAEDKVSRKRWSFSHRLPELQLDGDDVSDIRNYSDTCGASLVSLTLVVLI